MGAPKGAPFIFGVAGLSCVTEMVELFDAIRIPRETDTLLTGREPA